MIERKPERRSLPTPGDRRKPTDQPRLDWSDTALAMPGAIRPAPGEVVRKERRRFPDSGEE